MANVYTIVAELELVIFSLVTASLLIYTGVVGYQVKTRLENEQRQRRQDEIRGDNNSQTFLDNYRAFKKIVDRAVADSFAGHRGSDPAHLQPLVPATETERPAAHGSQLWCHLRGLGVRPAERQAARRLQEDLLPQISPSGERRHRTEPAADQVDSSTRRRCSRPPGADLRRQCRGRRSLLAAVVADGRCSLSADCQEQLRQGRRGSRGWALGRAPTFIITATTTSWSCRAAQPQRLLLEQRGAATAADTASMKGVRESHHFTPRRTFLPILGTGDEGHI